MDYAINVMTVVCGIAIGAIAIWTFAILPRQQRKLAVCFKAQVLEDYGISLTAKQVESLIYFGATASRSLWLSESQLLTYENGEDRINLSIVQPSKLDDGLVSEFEEGPSAPLPLAGIWKRNAAGEVVNVSRR